MMDRDGLCRVGPGQSLGNAPDPVPDYLIHAGYDHGDTSWGMEFA
jgi:hypothetical protein